jgi:ParB family chromosome partitioning protein
MIIAGERRWRASRLAGLTEVPCIEMDLDEKEIAEIALIENLQRKDLNIWEEADGLRALADKFGYTQDDIARKISKSRSTVTELMTIAGLPSDIRERCRTADISSKSTLLEVARQFDDAAMNEFLEKLITGEKVPLTKQPKKGPVVKTEVRPAEALKEPAGTGYSFSFQGGDDPKFELVLRFNDRETVGRGEILRALKKAFDAVKSEQADI